LCLLAVAAGLAPAQDPATLAKLRGQYQARCEAARTGYVATLRALHGSLQAAGKEAAAAAVAKELAAAENAMPSATARYVAIEPTPNLRTQSYLMVHELSKPATPVAGLGPDARVGSTDLPSGRLSVAADFSSELQETPDVFFFDFTGTETFTKENSIRSESEDEPVHIRFGPKVLHLSRAGKNIPVCVFGSYSDFGGSQMMDIDLVVAIEANCLFGDRTHAVRLVNGDGRLDCTGRRPRGARVCKADTVGRSWWMAAGMTSCWMVKPCRCGHSPSKARKSSARREPSPASWHRGISRSIYQRTNPSTRFPPATIPSAATGSAR
jgi:hypothetical protein